MSYLYFARYALLNLLIVLKQLVEIVVTDTFTPSALNNTPVPHQLQTNISATNWELPVNVVFILSNTVCFCHKFNIKGAASDHNNNKNKKNTEHIIQ